MGRRSAYGSLRPVAEGADKRLAGLGTPLRAWHSEGEPVRIGDHSIHVHRRTGGAPDLLLLHGFPGSSRDWRFLLTRDHQHAAVAFDFLGFGFSDKPRDHDYSLPSQADFAEELIRIHGEGRPVFVLGHDIGAMVATELIARDLEGALEMELIGGLLCNASIVQDGKSPSPAQQPLGGSLGSRFAGERRFRRQLRKLFSPAHPLTEEEADEQWSLITFNDGHRILDKLADCISEGERHAERWRGAIGDWPKPLAFAWGMEDPLATPRMLDGLRRLRPKAPVEELPGIGHYPQIEAPERIYAALNSALE